MRLNSNRNHRCSVSSSTATKGGNQVVQKTFQLYKKQQEFTHSPALYRAFCGGRGAGKTKIGAFDLIRRARRDRTYLVGSPTALDLMDTTYPTFREIAEQLGVWGSVKLSPSPTVQLTTGASVRFRSFDRPDRMRGPNLSGAWIDEASLAPEMVYLTVIPALREKRQQGWLSATFTPQGPTHWTHQTFNTGRPNTAIFRAPTSANPFNPPGFQATLEQQYGDTQFAQQELNGEFVAREGADFPPDWFDWPGFWFDHVDDLHGTILFRVLYIDPSRGLTDRPGDYQAFVTASLVRLANGRLMIALDCDLQHETPPDMIRRGIRIAQENAMHAICYEENGTMGFLAPEVERQLADRGVVQPWHTRTNTVPKVQRIRSLAFYLSRRQILIRNNRGGHLLRAQLGDVPFGEHDDGPDAAAGAVQMLGELTAGITM